MTARSSYNRPLWVLLIITALFAIPLFVAWLMAAEDTPLTTKTTNHGILLQPPLPFTQLNADVSLATANANTESWRGRWLVLYANPSACDAACEKAVFYIHQIRTATGKNANRVRTAVLSFNNDTVDAPLTRFLASHYPNTPHLTTQLTQYDTFVRQIPQAEFALQHGAIYLVDPLGNVLMVYRADTPPMGIFNDLNRLLKLSHIG